MGPGHGRTYCDHNGVPGGREDVRVVVPQVMFLQLLGEKLSGQLASTDRWKCKDYHQRLSQALPKVPFCEWWGLFGWFGFVSFFVLQTSEGKHGKSHWLNHNYIHGQWYLLNKTVAY